METYIVWEARSGNFWDADSMIEAREPLEAANKWLTTAREAGKTSIELRVCLPMKQHPFHQQWAVELYRSAPYRGWEYRIREMQPVAWVVHCVLDQTLGILGPNGFDISHKDATLFSTEAEAIEVARREREDQRAYLKAQGFAHGDDDLDVFEDPMRVFEIDEYRRRPDTW